VKWESLDTIGTTGSEGGVIVRDEVTECCRITLEQLPDRFAVTCGIAGAFVHTAFCGSESVYDSMKQEISAFCERDTTPEQEFQFYEEFAMKY
jgi:hypothetical protein